MKKRGCLTWIIGFLIICFMIPFYVLAWIPAIGFIIYYLVKRNFSGKRKRNFINQYHCICHFTSMVYLGGQ